MNCCQNFVLPILCWCSSLHRPLFLTVNFSGVVKFGDSAVDVKRHDSFFAYVSKLAVQKPSSSSAFSIKSGLSSHIPRLATVGDLWTEGKRAQVSWNPVAVAAPASPVTSPAPDAITDCCMIEMTVFMGPWSKFSVKEVFEWPT